MSFEAQRLYAEMGAVPVINAIGNLTMLGGSSPSPAVQEAMQLAGRYYVDMDEFFCSTGAIIAGMLECEAALVTPGCAAALVLGTAACMTGADPEKMGRLPDATGMKREVVIQAAQRYKYDRVIRLPGARIVEAGTDSGTTPEELKAALGPETAALLYPATGASENLVSLPVAIEIAHQYDIPVIVDAAYRVYPLDGLKQYAAWGADLVGYGAKYFGAPNSSGLLCGREDLVQAARLQNFASFEKKGLPGMGRPLKIDRQEIVAVVVALREWLEMDHEGRIEAADQRGRNLQLDLAGLPHVKLSPRAPDAQVTGFAVHVDEVALGYTAETISAALRQGSPSIWVEAHDAALHLSMFTVVDGDEYIIAERLRAIITGTADVGGIGAAGESG